MAAFQGEAHKRRFVVAHGAVRLLLAHHLQQSARDLVFSVGSHGKPHLDAATALEFNLSHSGELALIAVALGRAVGVDVESLSRGPFDLPPIARRVLAAPEQEWLAGTAEPCATGRLPAAVGLQRGRVQSSGRGLHDRLCPHPDRPAPALARAAAGRARSRRRLAVARPRPR